MTEKTQPTWNDFKVEDYLRTNYQEIHAEDQTIINHLSQYFAQSGRHYTQAIDVGAGPNLYPALLIQPYVDSLQLFEYSAANIEYLTGQLKELDENWNNFIKYLGQQDKVYQQDIAQMLRTKTTVQQGSIYQLPQAQYDLATMFFCAESITSSKQEFIKACTSYAQSVVSGGTLIAAFMENSEGYKVGDQAFPAVAITGKDIKQVFGGLVSELDVSRVGVGQQAFRDGYSGMLLMTAKRL